MARSTRLGCLFFFLLLILGIVLAKTLPHDTAIEHAPVVISDCDGFYDMHCA